ncbi:MAG: hypothetical protein Q9218_000865 [Villophora microphyllina]
MVDSASSTGPSCQKPGASWHLNRWKAQNDTHTRRPLKLHVLDLSIVSVPALNRTSKSALSKYLRLEDCPGLQEAFITTPFARLSFLYFNMPKSKRAKVIHLTKTQKKGKELTLRLYANVQECIPQFPYIYVFSVENMRNNYLKNVRTDLAGDSRRIFFGKTRVMARALGDSPSTEPYPSTSLLFPHLSGPCGLIFSHREPPVMLAHFDNYHPLSYARAGTTSTFAFTLPSGALVYNNVAEENVPIAAHQEPTLRKLGVPTRMEKGRVMLEEPFEVCKEGEVLGSGQTTLLKMFGVQMAEFGVRVRAWWTKETGEVNDLERGGDGGAMARGKGGIVNMDMGENREDEGSGGFEDEG